MEVITLIKGVVELGSVGICLYWIYTLRQEVKDMKGLLTKKEDEHKKDLKLSATEMSSLLQNTITDAVVIMQMLKDKLNSDK